MDAFKKRLDEFMDSKVIGVMLTGAALYRLTALLRTPYVLMFSSMRQTYEPGKFSW